jgi:hypothetical protein
MVSTRYHPSPILCAFILFAVLVFVTACGRKEAVKAGTLDTEGGSFSLYAYDDSSNKGDSSITLYRETVRGAAGEDEIVWTLSGSVTGKYEYGYAGVSIIPDGKTLARLQNGAETIKLRISGDGKRYRFSVETKNVTDDNTFGKEITVPRRSGEIIIPIAGLKQEDWGIIVPFDQSLITNLKIQTIGQPVPSFRFTIHRIEIP